jgi:hypothetical protein
VVTSIKPNALSMPSDVTGISTAKHKEQSMNQIKTWQERQSETGIGSVEAKDDEIRDLRQAIEAAEKQEPVAWMRPSGEGYDSAFRDHSTVIACTGNPWTGFVPLYLHPTTVPAQPAECWCTTCRPITMSDMRFVVCPDCGNKRCPRAHNHALACTSSNEPGQAGSTWENVAPTAPAQPANLVELHQIKKAPAQPLTDEQIEVMYQTTQNQGMSVTGKPSTRFARAIEAHIKGESL